MLEKRNKDWTGFWMHALFGAALGALIGLWVWLRPRLGLYDSALAGVLLVGGGALVVGFIASILRDDFWG